MEIAPATFEVGDLRFAADVAGPAGGTPVLLLHGAGQTRASWRGAVEALGAAGFHAIAVDLRGHGGTSPASDGDYRYERFADDVRGLVRLMPSEPFVVGASLGGLAALLALGEEPAVAARALVLVDIVPNLEVGGADEIIAFMRAAPDGFASLEDARAAIAAYLPHRPAPKNAEGLRKNLRLSADGRWRWHWDPRLVDGVASSKLPRARLEAAARALRLPTLLVRGERSRVVSSEGARHFAELAPHAEHVEVPGAEHMVAGDRNDAFVTAIVEFLCRR